ncbi:MAG: hypothetical protein ACTSRZ_01350 [Promethearchaeota archaeon]
MEDVNGTLTGTFKGFNDEIEEKLSELIDYAIKNIDSPICYEFLKYVFPKEEYPKQIAGCTVMGADGDPTIPIKLTILLMEKYKKST